VGVDSCEDDEKTSEMEVGDHWSALMDPLAEPVQMWQVWSRDDPILNRERQLGALTVMQPSLIRPLGLDIDIVDRILTFLPDFLTLQNVLTASKALYAVFQAHPNSIVRAVAYNVVGSALPQALRLVRCQDGSGAYDTLEEDVVSLNITSEEARKLAANTTVVHALEDLFSWRHSILFHILCAAPNLNCTE
jgi:hypothetical protein